jgi:hypothetical protein
MKWLTICVGLSLVTGIVGQVRHIPNVQHPQRIEYRVERVDGSFYGGTLLATVGGKSYTPIDESKRVCLSIVDERDWDGNGLTDALVKRIEGCGGNCCPDSFFFVSALAGNRFEISDDLADSPVDPIIEKWKNRWSLVIVSTNDGANTDPPVEITQRFILRAGKGIKVEEWRRADMDSILEMRSSIFKGACDEHSIEYDLDGDGRSDVISGQFFARWGSFFWTVRFANGKEFQETHTPCKRIGVLTTKTNGVNDLVCDQDTVFRWNGQGYQ